VRYPTFTRVEPRVTSFHLSLHSLCTGEAITPGCPHIAACVSLLHNSCPLSDLLVTCSCSAGGNLAAGQLSSAPSLGFGPANRRG
jgi:hypothetical protein